MSLPENENDRVLVFSYLLVTLAGDRGGGNQHAKLPVSQPRNQPGNLSNAYGIRLGSVNSRRVALGFQCEVHVNGIIAQPQDVVADCVATAVDRGPRNLVDDHTPVVKDSDAAQFVGQSVEVQGLVVAVTTSRKGNTFINFGAPYPNQTFTGYIPAGTALATDPWVESLRGKRIAISGTLALYKGKPEIRISDKSQIKEL